MQNDNNWYQLPEPELVWLVDGLITSDGHAAICGKPKAGKSTFIRTLITTVIKGGSFLDRKISIINGPSRVLYVHLDRKDKPWRVAKELRELGLTEEESERLIFRTAEEMPDGDMDTRLEWLQKEVIAAAPHLIVIDLLLQFLTLPNANSYSEVLKAVNGLQDKLRECGYGGALVVALHSRKATNPDDPYDDMLGSSALRGSFSTIIMLSHHRKESIYTVSSDQTDRDDEWGELAETVIDRDSDGRLTLGKLYSEVVQKQKQLTSETDMDRLLSYLGDHPGTDVEVIMKELAMSGKHFLKLKGMAGTLIYSTGKGVKGDPFLYFFNFEQVGIPPPAAQQTAEVITNQHIN